MRLYKTRTQFKRWEPPSLEVGLPSVVLVGRPNVGKSTLFNRLTQRDEAIVSDLPGLTRDRLYGLGRVGNRPYLVIDTGGLGVSDPGLEALMAQQVQKAIEQADHILMIVEAAGLNSEDQVIAQRLRVFNKPITLVVNKSEGAKANIINNEGFDLGLGIPQKVSALQGKGIHHLMEQ